MADTTPVFGPFSLDRSGKVLLRDGAPVDAGQRGIALLKALIAARGSAVTKAELLETAWPDVIVDEGNLTVQIASLRKVLGITPDGGEWIVTVPRVGYRLAGQAPTPPTAPRADAASRLPMLAVLPFENIGGDPEQEYFADGVVEDIITALSRFRSFAVIARNSSFVYKGRAVDVRQVGSELGVQYVLEGSVRRAGGRLRIAAQLIDAAAGNHLWANTFEGDAGDVFNFQDRITEGVVAVLEPEIQRAEIDRSRRERPGSVTAYDFYLRGLQHFNRKGIDDNAAAYDEFAKAIALEPNNGRALINAAVTIMRREAFGWRGSSPDNAARAVDLAYRAVEAAPNDGHVLATACATVIHTSREFEIAEQLIERALEANPNSFWVHHCAAIWHLHCGDLEQARGYFERDHKLNPADLDGDRALAGMSHVLLVSGQYEEALKWAQRSFAINRNWSPTYWMLVAANAHLGRLDEARQYLAQFMTVSPDTTIAKIKAGQPNRIPGRIEPILEGLRLAGLPEG